MKFFVLDSIARSGTTLLSAILRSLDGCDTLDGVFIEPFACEEFDGLEWPHGYGNKPLLSPTEKPNLSIDRLKKNSTANLHSERLSGGKSKEEWNKVLEDKHFNIDDLYNSIASSYDAKVLGFRWNQQIFYSRIWLERSPDNFWMTIVRNPYDRIYSNMKTHNWPFEQALSVTNNYNKCYRFLEQNYKNFILIKYEDLILKTDFVIENLTKKLSLPYFKISANNLLGSNYKTYRSQGHRAGKDGKHRIHGESCHEFYKSSMNQGKQFLKDQQIKQISNVIEALEYFKKYVE